MVQFAGVHFRFSLFFDFLALLSLVYNVLRGGFVPLSEKDLTQRRKGFFIHFFRSNADRGNQETCSRSYEAGKKCAAPSGL
jgi:hypothetical protein